MTASLKLKRLPHADGLALPDYETTGAAGMDLRAAVLEDAPLTLKPGMRDAVPTGLIMEIPIGFEGQVRPRSGLALKYGVTCLNSPGTIDSDYRGEVKVILANLGSQDFVITRGMRIAQLVIAPVTRVEIVEIEEASDTQRGTGGFGSTGSH
jgi:dUTP pyrophosphatase